MKKILLTIFAIILIFSKTYAYDSSKCEEQSIFFLVNISWKTATFSNFYCEYGKNIQYQLSKPYKVNTSTFIEYDKDLKSIKYPSKQDILSYVADLKIEINDFKNSSSDKESLIDSYLESFQDYENDFFEFIKNQIFTNKEKIIINERLEKMPLKIFQNTYWERLLMNWKIISREEWWADENYSKKEIYMKWCEDYSCYKWPVASNILKENYLKYFNDLDKKNKLTKTFDDWRDTLSYYPVDRIIIHHTAWWYKWIKPEWMAYMKAVHRYHALTLRWSDIWYHYLIDGEGNIYEWRAWWKYVLWAHVSTHNYWTIWISLMSDWYYSPEMLASLQDLVIYLWKEYNLELNKKTTVRNIDLTWTELWWAVLAHKELDSRKPKDPEIDMDIFRQEIASRVSTEKYVLNKN